MKRIIVVLLILVTGKITAQNPAASFVYDVEAPSGCVRFTNTSSADVVNYLWSFGDGTGSQSTQQNSYFCYGDTGCFHVKLWVQNQSGNTDSVTQTVCVHGETTVFIPNAFTPNGDGKNDVFRIYGFFIPENKFEMRIYDYWGGLVFYSDDPGKGWDGRCNLGNNQVQMGYYLLEMNWFDINNEEHTYRGPVCLLR